MAVLLVRAAVLAVLVLLLEVLCRTGVIDPLTILPPSAMVAAMIEQLASGDVTDAMLRTFSTVALAFLAAVLLGTAIGALVHAVPRLRRAIEPLLASYYSVPTFVFYPLLVALLGLSMAPLVVLGLLSAAPAVMISTLAGLDSVSPVLRKVARVQRLDFFRTLRWIVLPAAMPSLFSGFKLALSYSLIGVIAGEFILSGNGLGYAISFAYQSFDNRAMYGLMLFVLLVAIVANGVLYTYEGRLAHRRRRG
ncbi:MAG: ABC transporter permease subunit [Acidisphaera sp.]|nr:ABC transporter permease subunit [Acidisphaera sp.]